MSLGDLERLKELNQKAVEDSAMAVEQTQLLPVKRKRMDDEEGKRRDSTVTHLFHPKCFSLDIGVDNGCAGCTGDGPGVLGAAPTAAVLAAGAQ